MATENCNAAEDSLPNFKRVFRRICAICDEKYRCQELRHPQQFVERWMCLICSEEHVSEDGVIQHMGEEHERAKTRAEVRFEESHAKVMAQMCSRDLGSKEPRTRAEARFEDLHAKVMAQMCSRN